MTIVLLAAAIWFASLIAAVHAWLRWRSNRRRPPGPPASLFLGHIQLLGELPHRSLQTLSKTYGDLMLLRFGWHKTLIASSPEMAKEILKTHDLAFANKPGPLAAGTYMFFNSTDMNFSPHGPYWKKLRHLFSSHLFSAKSLDGFKHVREQEIHGMLPSILSLGRAGQVPITLRSLLLQTSNNIISRMVAGCRMSDMPIRGGGQRLLGAIDEILLLCGVFHLGDYVPFLNRYDPQGYVKRMKAVAVTMHSVMQEVIDSRRAVSADLRHGSKHLLDLLLEPSDEPLSDNDIMGIILDLFTGGSDTSGAVLEWTMAELLKNPFEMRKVQEELENVVGHNRLVNEDDICNLPYLCAIVKESMRLHPIGPFIMRMTSKEVSIEGYVISPKTRAYVNVWAIHTNPNIWERPLEFLPQRFLNSNIDLKGQNFEFLPFGSGRRICPGITLGLLSVHLMLATLLQSFTWLLPSHTKEVDLTERFGLSLKLAKPLVVVATPKMPLHFYKNDHYAIM